MLKISYVVMFAILMLAGDAVAAPKNALDVREAPAKQVERVRRDLAEGKTYSEISLDQRSKVEEALVRVSSAFERYPDLQKMPEADKVAVFNDQETINAILTKAGEDSRLICKREKTIGSHMSNSNCMTAAARRRIQDRNQRDLSNAQRTGRALGGD